MKKIKLRRKRSLKFTTSKKPLAAAKRFSTSKDVAHRDEGKMFEKPSHGFGTTKIPFATAKILFSMVKT